MRPQQALRRTDLNCQMHRFCYRVIGNLMKIHTNYLRSCSAAFSLLVVFGSMARADESSSDGKEPRIINPGPPPSDAIVLFSGEDLSQWKSVKGDGPAKWEVKDGVAT